MQGFIRRNPHEPEFHQAVKEVAEVAIPYINKHPELSDAIILERLTEPDRVFTFRVSWEDEQGHHRVNRGYRVQFNNALGPYKGGLRFHPTVNLSILKFLAFEQTFKNALTSLPLGSAKGGADFNPRGKTNREILRFCKSYMLELFRYIGPNIDVPAGDIGVSGREIGYLFGQYKRITGEYAAGTITGKSIESGGSHIRREATGFGVVYFAEEMLNHISESIEGKSCAISGSGNVAQFCASKIMDSGGKVLTLSDSDGFIYAKDGLSQEHLDCVMDIKNNRHERIKMLTRQFPKVQYIDKKRPWQVRCDLAFPCATQNELELKDAERLVKNGCRAVIEGANMPCTEDAVLHLRKKKVLFGPAKAANAGGVAVSGLEMSQSSQRVYWDEVDVDARLRNIMRNIHAQCVLYAPRKRNYVDYLPGANIAGFIKVANAMLSHGV